MIPGPQELIRAGVHVGHRKSKWNPKMAPFVFGVRNNVHIIDVFKTIDKLTEAIEFLKEIKQKGGAILFVGVKIETKEIVRETAEALQMPYVLSRWLGGLFTNYKVIKERIRYFRSLEDRMHSEDISKYTKKEQLSFSRELQKLERELGGIKNMEQIPQAIVVSDIGKERAAVEEARKLKIPVVAIIDTDGDPTAVDYPIPANDSAHASLSIIYGAIRDELKAVTALPAEESGAVVEPKASVPEKEPAQ
jgi:small subunit ribosomal protein S2